jgi:hypothetical protein
MGPLQHLEFWKQMKTTANDPLTAASDAANLHTLLGVGLKQFKARRAFEKQAESAIVAKAMSMGMTEDEMTAAEMADDVSVGAILPAGWFAALVAALPKILSFISAILAMLGLTPAPVPVPPTPTPVPPAA